ncbi:MAG: glycosyltransferase family 9 protein [bacterium]
MRILVVNLLYLGDLLFSTPALRVLHNAYPGVEIEMLVNREACQIVQHNPLLHKVYPIDAPKRMEPLSVFLDNIKLLRSRSYDMAICLHYDNERATIITAFSGAKQRGGFAKPGMQFLYNSPAVTYLPAGHTVEQNLHVLREFGVPEAPHNNLEMWPGDEGQEKADRLWQEAGLAGNDKVIGLNPSASFPTKLWTVEGFAQVSDMLTRDGYTPVLFGGPMDVERADAISALTTYPPISFAGKVNLLGLVALIKKCSTFISADTGPMHIAAAQQLPIVALYGPTKADLFGPYGTEHVVITSDLPCLRCEKRQCDDVKCMAAITPEMVYQGFLQLQQASVPRGIICA